MIKIKAKRVSGLRGNMFSKKIENIYFETRFGVHTFFVKKPLLVLILDKDSIVRRKKILKPWRILFWPFKYKRVVELPAVFDQKIKKGGKVSISFKN